MKAGPSSIISAFGTFLVVQWLRLCSPSAGGPGSIPGQGTKIATKTQLGQNKNKYKKIISALMQETQRKPEPLLPCENSVYEVASVVSDSL